MRFGKLELSLVGMAVVFMIGASIFLGGCSKIEVDCPAGKVVVTGGFLESAGGHLGRQAAGIVDACPKGATGGK